MSPFFMSTLFRQETSDLPQEERVAPAPNRVGGDSDVSDIEPVEGKVLSQEILNTIGIDDDIRNLPEEDLGNLNEISEYLQLLAEKKQITPTRGAYQRLLNDLLDSMNINRDMEPSAIIERLAGVHKAWKSLSFVRDPQERRSLFMKLAKQTDSKSMDEVIYEEMNNRKIWR